MVWLEDSETEEVDLPMAVGAARARLTRVERSPVDDGRVSVPYDDELSSERLKLSRRRRISKRGVRWRKPCTANTVGQ